MTLSVRAQNLLRNADIDFSDKPKLRELIESGEIKNFRNVGIQTENELRAFVGIQSDISEHQKVKEQNLLSRLERDVTELSEPTMEAIRSMIHRETMRRKKAGVSKLSPATKEFLRQLSAPTYQRY